MDSAHPEGDSASMRNTRLAVLGDALLGLYAVEWLLGCGGSNSDVDA
jgi:hypothetical protein